MDDVDFYIDTLREYSQWNEEIPKEILRSNGKKGAKYKCRGAWFTVITSSVESCIDLGLLSDNSKKLYERLYEYLEKTKFGDRLTTPEDIEKADKLLNSAISDLSQLVAV